MANAPEKKGIKNSWALMAFVKLHGKMQVGDFTSVDENGEKRDFKSCIFSKPDADGNITRVFVAFSSNLGVLSPAEIAERKNDLQVVQLESDTYILCKNGDNAWADVNL